MDVDFPFSITGEHFILNTQLTRIRETGFKFERSTLSRSFFDATKAGEQVLKLQSRGADLSANLQLLQSTLPFALRAIFLEEDQILILDKNGLHSQKISLADILSKQTGSSLAKKIHINSAHLKGLAAEGLVVPANDYSEELLNKTIFEMVLRETASIWPENFDGLTVFCGELVWSGWFDTFQFLNYLLAHRINSAYFSLDRYGIWEKLLLDLRVTEKLKYLNKNHLEPELFFIDNSGRGKMFPAGKILLEKEGRSKSLHLLEQSFMLFDIKESGFNLAGSKWFLPRYLLVKNNAGGQIREQDFIKTQGFFQQKSPLAPKQIYPQTPLRQENEVNFQVKLLAGIKSSLNFNTELDANDMVCKLVQEREKYILMPSQYSLYVCEGQLVQPGEQLFVTKGQGRAQVIAAEFAGKVSLRLIDKGILTIIIAHNMLSFSPGISGILKTVSKNGGLLISGSGWVYPLGIGSAININGILTEWQGNNKVATEDLIQPLLLYIRNPLPASDPGELLFRTGKVAGVLVKQRNYLNSRLEEDLHSSGIPVIELEHASANLNPDIEKLLHYNLGKYIQIDQDGIKIPAVQSAGMELLINSKASLDSHKGGNVKFFNYQSINLYGKIEKCPRAAVHNFLVNAPDGIFEIRPENIILLN